jgi:hypothetical protein
MSEAETLPGDAGERFASGMGFAFEDAQQRRLRYHLLRLTTVGLTRDDVQQLGELARLAFEDADLTDQLRAISERADVSSLASAIAAIVERCRPGSIQFGAPADVLVGAVLGAYAGLLDTPDRDRTEAAVLGAIGGGTAASVSRFVQTQLAEVGPTEYVRMDEPS